jgi:hypothetical protein
LVEGDNQPSVQAENITEESEYWLRCNHF